MSPRARRLLELLALLGYAAAVLRTAWLCDDSYITLRTVDNWVNGYGLRWNVAERVQAYTHPLWLLLISPFYWVTREALYTVTILSAVVSVTAVALGLFRPAISRPRRVWAVAVLVLSRTFLSFSTGGLENPLLYLLLAVFVILFFKEEDAPRRFFFLALVAALGALTRLDSLLLFAPPLALRVTRQGLRRSIPQLVIGFTPLIVWFLFSLFYYGSIFPNTAYAKLNTGLPPGYVMAQGIRYFRNLLKWDCLAFFVIVLGVASTVSREGRSRTAAFGAGLVFYFLYLVHIGGDFMCGRFFAAPMFLAVLLLVRAPIPPWLAPRIALWLAALPLVGLFSIAPGSYLAWLSGSTGRHFHEDGITDERLYAYPTNGLWAERPPLDAQYLAHIGLTAKRRGIKIFAENAIGQIGYYAGPGVHIVDNYALADPLLARLPAQFADARIGHFERYLPIGYVKTLESGQPHIRHPGLAAYYEKLSLISRGPLLSAERLMTIFRMSCGVYDHWLAEYRQSESGERAGNLEL